ncbi:hypothetical protein I3842_04G120500 [Carya illinoinensis]|uniref:NADH:ubiquinone reductase (non-electrogenic) n=1 Tax=Carya illinoinensis TaxID=32201 RepID=A0A922JRI9_CARIL|nr:hypothetical protein I3842_04G120500 [Carya illinoinensis]
MIKSGYSLFERASRTFRNHPTLSKLLLVSTVSGGGYLVASSDGRPYNGDKHIHSSSDEGKKKKVVVLGTGCAGTSFLRNLSNPSYDVHVVSPRNYFVFSPLLPSLTCGTVEARSIIDPIRTILLTRKAMMSTSKKLIVTRLIQRKRKSIVNLVRTQMCGVRRMNLL